MKNRRVFLVSVIFGVFILAVAIFGLEIYRNNQPLALATPKAMFVLKEYGGKIALFLPGEDKPNQIYPDPYVRDLPEADRKELESGIAIYSNEQLQNLIADLCS